MFDLSDTHLFTQIQKFYNQMKNKIKEEIILLKWYNLSCIC